MFEVSLLSAACFESCEDPQAKDEFLAFVQTAQQERLADLERNDYDTRAMRNIELKFVTRVIDQRIRRFDAQTCSNCLKVLESGTFLFRHETSLLDAVIADESEGFFDDYDTPHPAYWVDYRIFPIATGRQNQMDGFSSLVSWLPKNLYEKFRDMIQLSPTGELDWLDDVLMKPQVDPELVSYAAELVGRMNQLKHLLAAQ